MKINKSSCKKPISVLLSAVLAAAMFFALSVASYADETATVNGEPVKAGDTVTFEYRFGSVSDPLEGAEANIEYDPAALEYVDGSIGFDVFKNAVYTISEGKIYYSAIDVISGFDFSNEEMAVKLSFKVLDGAKGDLKITHTFGEIFTLVNEETDLTSDDYTENIVTTVNTYTENDAPNKGLDANNIEEFTSSDQTDLDEYLLGTDKDEFISSNAAAGNTTSGSTSDQAVSSADTNNLTPSVTLSENSSEGGSGSKSNVIVFVVAVVLVILIAAAIILSVKMKKKPEDKE